MQPYPVEDIIKIQPKGLITIPKQFRDALGFKENSLARVRAVSGKLIVEPVHVLPYPVRNYNDNEVEEFFALDEKETKTLPKTKHTL